MEKYQIYSYFELEKIWIIKHIIVPKNNKIINFILNIA